MVSKIVTLCGSARLHKDMSIAAAMEIIAGNIVLGLSCNVADLPGDFLRSVDTGKFWQHLEDGHLRKIDMSDEVLVVAKDGKIGDRTTQEIEYAKKLGKTVRYFQPV